MRRASLLIVALSCLASIGVGAAPQKPTVLVRSFTVGDGVGTDGSMLSGTFCLEFAHDSRLDVTCEAELAQLMDFAAQRALHGDRDASADPIMERMANVDYIVDGRVVKGKHGLIFEVSLTHNDIEAGGGSSPVAGERVGGIRKKGIKGGVEGLLKELPALAKRSAAMLGQGENKAPPAPPAPMKDK